nr:DUF4405 domain-containing protein [uncultured Carboxylicivirga sp.]
MINQLIVNIIIFITGLSTVLSGILIQLNYHIGQNYVMNYGVKIFGLNYKNWTEVHKASVVLFLIFIICHWALHGKWLKTIINKKLFKRNLQVIALSIVFLIVSISGFISWMIFMSKGDEGLRKEIIEIHDKVGVVLSVLLIMHTIKRQQWFFKTLNKLK